MCLIFCHCFRKRGRGNSCLAECCWSFLISRATGG
eukprot:XP_001709288.1 Hypothetical protein GL50803_39190 [Giardia lamblia ATCC 50803]